MIIWAMSQHCESLNDSPGPCGNPNCHRLCHRGLKTLERTVAYSIYRPSHRGKTQSWTAERTLEKTLEKTQKRTQKRTQKKIQKTQKAPWPSKKISIQCLRNDTFQLTRTAIISCVDNIHQQYYHSPWLFCSGAVLSSGQHQLQRD